ncbi:hypothetical protein ACWD0J_41290 [Streptomyces sp. NPDC003011]
MDTISKQYEQHEQYQRYRARKRPLSGTQDGNSYGGGAPWES